MTEYSVEINRKRYGAVPDRNGPIGGGEGYKNMIREGDYTVRTLDELLTALTQAKPGQVIFIPGQIEIDLTARIYIAQLVIEIGPGITLAGDRGQDGSAGALICSDALNTPVMIRIAGVGVRITGLRLKGPNAKRYLDHHERAFKQIGCVDTDPERRVPGKEVCRGGDDCPGHRYYFKFPLSCGMKAAASDLEVDNCEISAFGNTGITLLNGCGHHIHHNHLHHCQYNGLGYGVTHHKAFSLIEQNLFHYNRHSIAGSGVSGSGYVACHNVDLGGTPGHSFDMHGSASDGTRGDQDASSIAGTSIEIYHNTFFGLDRAVDIRGVPEKKSEIHHNWFVAREDAVGARSSILCENNACGRNPIKIR